jgi:hypothetical protein
MVFEIRNLIGQLLALLDPKVDWPGLVIYWTKDEQFTLLMIVGGSIYLFTSFLSLFSGGWGLRFVNWAMGLGLVGFFILYIILTWTPTSVI